jgi:hypothetical protein
MTNTRHTPTPWSLQNGLICALNGRAIIDPGHIAGETEEECEANAAFIVRAVNNHEALVESLKGFLSPFDGWDMENFFKRADPATLVRVTKARAALANAEANT